MRNLGRIQSPGATRTFAALGLLVILAATARPGSAGPLAITRWTVDGGGSSAVQGGSFVLGATAGQPDAGTLAAGPYRLGGGFWGTSAPSLVAVGGPPGGPGDPPPGADPAVKEFRIHPAAPNPTLGLTRIAFDMPEPREVEARVFGVHGGLVRTLARGPWSAGRHALAWDGRDADGHPVEAGLYFVRVRIGTLEKSMKLVVMR